MPVDQEKTPLSTSSGVRAVRTYIHNLPLCGRMKTVARAIEAPYRSGRSLCSPYVQMSFDEILDISLVFFFCFFS